MTWLWGGGGELPYPLQWLRMGFVGEGVAFVLCVGISAPPTVHRYTWLAGAPKAQHSALPSQGQIPAPGMAAMGPVSSSYFWQDVQGGPGEAEGQLPVQEKSKEVIS